MNKETICCPVCNARLRPIGGFYDCPNDHREWAGTRGLWQALIQSQKDLEIARKALEYVKDAGLFVFAKIEAEKALGQIEHKEK